MRATCIATRSVGFADVFAGQVLVLGHGCQRLCARVHVPVQSYCPCGCEPSVMGRYNIHSLDASNFCSLSNSFSRSIKISRHFSCSLIIFPRASSNRSASSLSMSLVNSGTPAFFVSCSDPGFDVWNGIGLLVPFGSGVGGFAVSNVRNGWNGSVNTISSYCHECTGPSLAAFSGEGISGSGGNVEPGKAIVQGCSLR